MRQYSYSRHLKGGCFICHAGIAQWFGKNTQGVAARHHDATGHQTWVDIAMTVFYGRDADDSTEAVKAEGDGT